MKPRTHSKLRPRALVDFVSAVDARLPLNRKTALFQHFAERLAPTVGGDAQLLLGAFRARERAQNTAVGRGVALPHAMLEAVDRSVVGVFTSAAPIDYRAPDGAPVDVFFAIVGPQSDREAHLRLLSTIARLSLKTDLLALLRAAKSRDEIMGALTSSSAALKSA